MRVCAKSWHRMVSRTPVYVSRLGRARNVNPTAANRACIESTSRYSSRPQPEWFTVNLRGSRTCAGVICFLRPSWAVPSSPAAAAPRGSSLLPADQPSRACNRPSLRLTPKPKNNYLDELPVQPDDATNGEVAVRIRATVNGVPIFEGGSAGQRLSVPPGAPEPARARTFRANGAR